MFHQQPKSKAPIISASFNLRIENADACAQEICDNTKKILLNINNGFSPIELENVYIFVNNTKNIRGKDAINLLCNFDTPEMLEQSTAIITPDALILMQICTGCDQPVPGTPMGAQMKELQADYHGSTHSSSQVSSMDKAVAAIVRLGVRRGLCTTADVDRLAKKYKIWLRGAKWNDCAEKPYPWDPDFYATKSALLGGILATNFSIWYDNAHPIDLVGMDKLGLFQMIWTRDRNIPNEEVEEACLCALQLGLEFQHEIKLSERHYKETERKKLLKRQHQQTASSCVVS